MEWWSPPNFVLGYAKSMLSKELGLQPEVRCDQAFITNELKMLHGFVAAANEEEGDGSEVVKIWLEQFHDVYDRAEDYLQDLAVRRKEKSAWRIIPLLLDRRHVARRVKTLRMMVQDVSQRRRDLGLFTGSGSNSKPTAPADAAALSYVAYDEYVLHGDCEATYADDGIPLQQYKEINQMLVEYDMFSEENGVLVLPGETDPSVVYQIASEQSKKIVRTILKSLRANELGSLCFTPFAESNLVVSSSGKVKFRNVNILRNLTGEALLQHQRNNYLSAQKIIEDLFSGNPPEEILHLLWLIEEHFEKRELFHIHGSLVSMAMYSTLFKDMYEHIRFVLPKEDLRAILGSLPYVDTWKTQIDTNEVLQFPFKYNPKSYKVPPNSQGQTCLNNDQRVALKHLGLTPQPHQQSLTPAQIKLIEALQFFEYLRNRTSHRMEPWMKWTETEANQPYNAQGTELVTHVRFPLIVAHLQLELYNMDRHREIPMDKFF